ncbi:MAG: ankyrin repeat domain-containing protein [Pseudomonadota bacterium]
MTELRTPLEIAIARNDLEAVQQRLQAGDCPQAPNHLGIPVLYDGLASENTDILNLLETCKPDWTLTYNPGGFTPLIYASLHCSLPTIRWLVERGQRPDQRTSQGVGVMHVAVQRPDVAVAEYLYTQGADPFAVTKHGELPLLTSLKSKHGLDAFNFLLTCYTKSGHTLTDQLMACLACIFDKQRDNAVQAVRALLPFMETEGVATEPEIRAYLSQPGVYTSAPFRSLDATLQTRLSRTLFALLKAERIGRASKSDTAAQWQTFQGL